MICAVYKSSRKADTYLFINKRDHFEDVPEALLEMFGTPTLVMLVPLDKRKDFALADIDRVKSELQDKGYYLQLPPPAVNLLEEHKREIGFTKD